MLGSNYPDLSKICRLCLEELLVDEFYIFKSQFCIPLRIMACTTLEVKESDNLPSAICKFCRIQLEKFYLFRKKCQISDVKLRKHVRHINSGKVSKVFSKGNDDDDGDDDYDEDIINSQKFIASFEIQEKTLTKQNEGNLVTCDKCTQTSHDMEAKIPDLNIGKRKLMGQFIIDKNDISKNVQNDAEINTHRKESKDSDIIYVIESEYASKKYENHQEVQIFVEEEDESFYSIKNESNESKTQIVDENDDSTTFIDGSCILMNEEENSNKTFDENSNDTKFEKVITKEFKHNGNEQEQSKQDVKVVFENKDVKLFKCHLCPQSFSRMFLLDKHLGLHKKSKSYICTVCKKHFAAKSSLHRHSRIHNGEKPYICDVCGKAFIQNEVLKRHRYLHLDKKPFQCSHCDQAFIQKNLLQHHITIKHSNKPIPKLFNCDICPKAFVHSSGLSRHLILHSGISYDCQNCNKKFTDKSALKRHAEIHSRIKSGRKYNGEKIRQKTVVNDTISIFRS